MSHERYDEILSVVQSAEVKDRKWVEKSVLHRPSDIAVGCREDPDCLTVKSQPKLNLAASHKGTNVSNGGGRPRLRQAG